MKNLRGASCLLGSIIWWSPIHGQAASPPSNPASVAHSSSFRNDVMAVLSKAGCNAGTCHGNKNGKGGFKLSLRGQNPEVDYLTLTRDLFARRVNSVDPAQSLLVLKPTTQVAHEGGLRFKEGSREYDILHRWIAAAMPNDLASAPVLERIEVTPREQVLFEPSGEVALRVRAAFADGSERDVTELAVYEPVNGAVKVSSGGLVQRVREGEATVLVRYLHGQEPVRLAFLPARDGFEWSGASPQNYIDQQIFTKLRRLRINPSKVCSDEVFLRRAYLDLLGIVPSAREARDFVDSFPEARGLSNPPQQRNGSAGILDREPLDGRGLRRAGKPARQEQQAKRQRVIDTLLGRSEFADFWALKWADLLRVEAHSLDVKGVQAFHHWIRRSILENKPLDVFARELVGASGSTYANPAANYYRPHREPAARAKAVAQVFLGTRLQCAECHNHPSDRWTQDDYYDWAALFTRVNYKVLENKREIASDEHEWNGEQVVFAAREGALKNPRTGRPAQPRLLGETVSPLRDAPKVGRDVPIAPSGGMNRRGRAASSSRLGPTVGAESSNPLLQVAAWLTSPTNTLFARVQANRVWFHLMGRGLVDPPDDFRATNPASHPELLDMLAKDLVEHKFDLRWLIRFIMSSRAYQLSCEPNETNAGDEVNYSHTAVRRLGAEQIVDSQSQVIGRPLRFPGYPLGLRAAQLPGVRPESKGKRRANPLDQFLDLFGKPPRLLTTDTERSCECSMAQAFQMISGPVADLSDAALALGRGESRLNGLLAAGRSDRQILDELFWNALTRPPKQEELDKLLPLLASAPDRAAEWQDLLWALLNSKEFLFRR